jgi:DNA recombination-dependent growth factor C
MDILGLFPKAFERRQVISIVVEYLKKWMEIEALTEITTSEVISFLKKYYLSIWAFPSVYHK